MTDCDNWALTEDSVQFGTALSSPGVVVASEGTMTADGDGFLQLTDNLVGRPPTSSSIARYGIGFFLIDGDDARDSAGPTGDSSGDGLGSATIHGQEGVDQGALGAGLDV